MLGKVSRIGEVLGIFFFFFKEGDTKEVTFEQSSEGNEGGRHVEVWGKGIPGRGTSKCKSPEAGACHH